MKPLDCVGIDLAKSQVGKHDFQPSPTEPIVHGVGQPPMAEIVLKERSPEDREAYYVAKIAELVTTKSELAAVMRERDALKATLDKIACWSNGPVVTGMFDEPASAKLARETLAKLERGDFRKPGA